MNDRGRSTTVEEWRSVSISYRLWRNRLNGENEQLVNGNPFVIHLTTKRESIRYAPDNEERIHSLRT